MKTKRTSMKLILESFFKSDEIDDGWQIYFNCKYVYCICRVIPNEELDVLISKMKEFGYKYKKDYKILRMDENNLKCHDLGTNKTFFWK